MFWVVFKVVVVILLLSLFVCYFSMFGGVEDDCFLLFIYCVDDSVVSDS